MNHSNQDIESLFAEAMNREAGSERDAFLEQACLGKAELRREIDSLLQGQEDAECYFNQAPPGFSKIESSATFGMECEGPPAGDGSCCPSRKGGEAVGSRKS